MDPSEAESRLRDLLKRRRSGEEVDLKGFLRENEEMALRLQKLTTDWDATDGREEVFGEFHLVKRIGRGGMGEVWKAQQRSLKRDVAIKFLDLRHRPSPRDEERFMNEARLAARLQHPHIVPVYTAGTESAQLYYVMEFVEGVTLDHVIAALRAFFTKGDQSELEALPGVIQARFGLRSGRRPSRPSGSGSHEDSTSESGSGSVMRVFRQDLQRKALSFLVESLVPVANALDYAHRNEVVHGDVKPSNLMFDRYGRLRLLDFGLARLVQDASDEGRSIGGTPRYMSPEQAAGLPGGLAPTIDVYALGATMYECLTLHPMYQGSSKAEVLQKIATENPPPPRVHNSKIHRHLEFIVMKAVSRQPKRRYASAALMATDLQRFLNHQPLEGTGALRFAALGPGRLGSPHTIFAAAVLLVALSIGGKRWFAWFGERRQVARIERSTSEARLILDGVQELLDAEVSGLDPAPESSTREPIDLVALVEDRLSQAWGLLLSARMDAPEPQEIERELEDFRRRSASARVLALALSGDTRSAWEVMESAKRLELLDDSIDRTLAELGLLSRLSVTTANPEGLVLVLRRIDPDTRDFHTDPVAEGRLPFEVGTLLAGSYHVDIQDPEGRFIRFPIRVEPSQDVRVEVPYAPSDVPPGMAYVSTFDDERFVIGDLLTTYGTSETGTRERVLPDALFLDRFEVTNREFFEFYNDPAYLDFVLDAMGKDAVGLASDELSPLLRYLPEDWELGQPPPGTEELPVRWGMIITELVGIAQWTFRDLTGAQSHAYAAWKGKELPTELQWEKAARGIDGRVFVYGDVFNPDLHFSEDLVEVGSFPADLSVYGVSDLMGSVSEICQTSFGQGIVVRGGAHWMEEPRMMRLAKRSIFGFHVGFRCAITGAKPLLVSRGSL